MSGKNPFLIKTFYCQIEYGLVIPLCFYILNLLRDFWQESGQLWKTIATLLFV